MVADVSLGAVAYFDYFGVMHSQCDQKRQKRMVQAW